MHSRAYCFLQGTEQKHLYERHTSRYYQHATIRIHVNVRKQTVTHKSHPTLYLSSPITDLLYVYITNIYNPTRSQANMRMYIHVSKQRITRQICKHVFMHPRKYPAHYTSQMHSPHACINVNSSSRTTYAQRTVNVLVCVATTGKRSANSLPNLSKHLSPLRNAEERGA